MAQHITPVSNLIVELAETKPVIINTNRSFTNPNIYRDFYWFTRKKEPIDPASMYGMNERAYDLD